MELAQFFYNRRLAGITLSMWWKGSGGYSNQEFIGPAKVPLNSASTASLSGQASGPAMDSLHGKRRSRVTVVLRLELQARLR